MNDDRHDDDRHGARQPHRFDPSRAAVLDETARFDYLPPRQIIDLLDLPQGGMLVDFGSGSGAYAIQIARARPDVTVIAFDEQPQMLERLRAKPEAALANLRTALPDSFREVAGRADRVLALNVLHELGDRAMRDLAAAPSRTGWLLAIDWDAATERPVGPPRDHTYDINEAVRRLEDAGLAVERLAPMRYHFVLRAHRRQ